MRCKACDCVLTVLEMKNKSPLTGEYEDLCAICLISAGVLTTLTIDEYEGEDFESGDRDVASGDREGTARPPSA